MKDRKVLRIIDANFNRLREGLRVLEETERLGRDRKKAFAFLKGLRHAVAACCGLFEGPALLEARDSEGDVGRAGASKSELRRANIDGIVSANFKRCQEAARVIEEFAKLINPTASKKAKAVRFKLYTVEKEWAK